MAASIESPAPDADFVWRRVATPRETMFGIRSDGSIRSTCSKIEIISSVEIKKEVLEKCTEQLSKNMECLHEFLMENKESKDIWIVKAKKENYVVEEISERQKHKQKAHLEKKDDIVTRTIGNEINCRIRAENTPNWKLYFINAGYNKSLYADSEKYPHICQLIFVFSTGLLDEFSCIVMCDLFLNILDCALKNVSFSFHSHLKVFDVGRELENKITQRIQDIQIDEQDRQRSVKIYKKMHRGPSSNFYFKEKEFQNKETQFWAIRYMFSPEKTQSIINICEKNKIHIYPVFIAIINKILLHHAVKKGFKGTLRTNVLHKMNTKVLLNKGDKDNAYKIGSFFLPYMQTFKLESTDVKNIFKEAFKINKELEKAIAKDLFWDQEAFRDLLIKESGEKYSSGNWNHNYCFSITDFGDLGSFFFPDDHNNKFQVLSYKRSSPALERGHLEIILLNFKGKLSVYFDYSHKKFSDKDMSDMIKTFTHVVQTILQIKQ